MYTAHIGPYVSRVKHERCERFKLNWYVSTHLKLHAEVLGTEIPTKFLLPRTD